MKYWVLLQFNLNIPQDVHVVESTPKPPLSKDAILYTVKDVFEGLGHIGNSTFVTDDTVKPEQHTPRRVPVALWDKVKEKVTGSWEERHHQEGHCSYRMDKQHGYSSKTGQDKNLLRPSRLKQSFKKTQVQDAYIGRIPSSTSKGKGFLNTWCKGWILPDRSW